MAQSALNNRKFVILGANASAIALVRFLSKSGAEIKVVDMRPQETVATYLQDHLDLASIQLECGEISQKTFEGMQTILVTPGYAMDSQFLEAARTAGIEVVSELDFVSQFI